MEDKCKTGRVTIPTDLDVVPETLEILKKWGADAIRDCDGTDFPQELKNADAKIYSTYYTTRKDNAWAKANPDEVQQCYIMTGFYTAPGETVTIPLMKGISPELMKVNDHDDITRWWEVMDRSTGQPVPPERWSYADGSVTVQAVPFHEYTVSFLAYLIWDPVHMYNATTNGWTNFEHQITFDVRQPKTHKYSMERLRKFIAEHPYVNVIRYTTFFHQFTLIFDELKREKFVDWYGYSASVSPYILNQFEQEVGYKFRPEYIIDQGYYNNQYRVPSKEYRDFQAFQRREVAKLAKEMVDITHECGCEAMMFLGDQWIGTEPYKDGFDELGLDAVVGSIGDGTTTRMIADIPGVKYTEGRFLPYFFPDTFYEGNDPSIEGLDNWRKARRAILRSPISRMGYGGYLSLAAKFPKFVDTVTHIADEFRDIHDRTGGVAAEGELNVAILNSWGKMRSWMAFTVAHALPNKQTYSYYGILESLSGMRVNVRFISFDDVLAHGIDSDIDVIINGGPVDTAFTGGDVWTNPKLVETVRAWVRGGGAFVGVGEPSSAPRFQAGRFFQLADVIGVDEERYQTLSVDKYFPPVVPDHFITADVPVDPAAREAWEQAGYRIPLSGCGGGQSIKPLGGIDFGEPVLNTYPVNENVTLLRADGGQVQLATNDYGEGRGVYISGLPYSAANARLLERVLFYASHNEDKYAAWSSSNPECEVAHFPEQGLYCVINNTDQPQRTTVTLADGTTEDFDLPDSGIAWREA